MSEYPFSELFDGLHAELRGAPVAAVTGLSFDSRRCAPGTVFFALHGTHEDGARYAADAVQKGASVVVSQQALPELGEVCNVVVPDVAEALGTLASRFYGDPSQKLKLVGVTGTNGKTTVVTLLHELMGLLGCKSGLLSTIENRVLDQVHPTTMTTPDPITVNALLREMVDAGCQYAFMEVSSHAAAQHRVAGLNFAGGVFTNITRDHLDYHKTFADYLSAKQSFFTGLPAEAFALVNIDDDHAAQMTQNAHCHVHTYSLQEMADYHAKVRAVTLGAMDLEVDGREVTVALLGRFNAYNLLAVYAVGQQLGFSQEVLLPGLSQLHPVRGRFDCQLGPNGLVVVVDYAHTPDALEKVYETIEEIKPLRGHIITVMGCGGNRDQEKRADMGKIAAQHSQWLFVTNDNPRNEDPEQIANMVLKGISRESLPQVFVELDRAKAIRQACLLAASGDYVLVAGKGHETYQEVQGQRTHFDDREEVFKAIEELKSEETAQ